MIKVKKFKLPILTFLFFCFFINVAKSDEFDDDFSAFESEMFKSETKIYDPLEPINRKIFTFNDYADEYFVDYVIIGYRFIFPKTARSGIRNFFQNLSKPFSVVNSFAQGKVDNALASLSSFLINSTIGILGIIDVAGDEEIRYNNETLGQTLGHYGVAKGPYLVLPLLGPSTLREFASDMTETSISPIGFDVFEVGEKTNVTISTNTKLALTGFRAVDKREKLSDLIADTKRDSLDHYAAIRSYYLQNLEKKVKE